MSTNRFRPDRGLTTRIAETWVMLLLFTAGYGALIGIGLQHLLGWPWWIGLVLPSIAVLAYRGEDGGVLPKNLSVVDADVRRYPELHATVDRLCALSDLPKPGLKIIDASWRNALTLQLPGRPPVIALTCGLLDNSDDAELEAVLAHELAHVLHRDAQVMTFATRMSTSLITVWVFIIDVFNAIDLRLCWLAQRCGHGWTSLFGDDSVPDRLASTQETVTRHRRILLDWIAVPLIGFLRVIAVLVFLPLTFATFLAMLPPALPVSLILTRLGRYREYAADRTAAMLTGHPTELAVTLSTLSDHVPTFPKTDLRELGMMSSMAIIPFPDASTGKQTNDIVDRVLGSHPPVAKRVERLVELGRDLAG